MRRCPVCDFIYEDDEKLCAMDGTGLVNHTGPLPFEESALPQAAAPRNSHWRGSTLIAAAIILAIALFFYFHKAARRNVLQSNPQAAAQTRKPSEASHPNPVAVPVETATPFVTPSPDLNPTPAKIDARPRSHRARQAGDIRAVPVETATPFPRPAPSLPVRANIEAPSVVFRSSPVKPNQPRSSPTPHTTDTNQKKESKVRSFLKKAGRLLKKPFEQ
jgi:hypothetical protein